MQRLHIAVAVTVALLAWGVYSYLRTGHRLRQQTAQAAE